LPNVWAVEPPRPGAIETSREMHWVSSLGPGFKEVESMTGYVLGFALSSCRLEFIVLSVYRDSECRFYDQDLKGLPDEIIWIDVLNAKRNLL